MQEPRRPAARPPTSSLIAHGRALLALLVGLSAGCNRAPCGGMHPASPGKLAPHLVTARTLYQDVIDPYSFVVELLFLAPHGDLSDGSLDLYVGSSPPVSLQLERYFGPSNVALGAKSGRLAVPVHFSSSALQDDSLLRLGLQLRDGSLFYSNCMTLELHVLVDRLGVRRVRPNVALARHCAHAPPPRHVASLQGPRSEASLDQLWQPIAHRSPSP